MTDKPTPTDAELEALLLDKLPASIHYIRPVIEKMVAAMQAAIDKCGQPAQVAEPVAWLDPWTGTKVTTDYDAYGKHGIPLYTAPQPVVREPLTDAQIAEMMRDTWGCASIAPRHALELARAVERAHGIAQKGGQHGTE